jgi:hypothetical protein
MSDMSSEPQHARTARSRDTAVIAAWAVLVIAALTSGSYNMVHAFEHSHGAPELPFLYGAVPPVLAALLAHVAAAYRSSRWIKAAVIAVTLASMSLSITSVAQVAAPMGGKVMSIVFGLAVDAAAMTALVLILDNHRRRAVAASALDEALAEARQARAEAQESAHGAAAMEAEVASALAAAERAEAEAEVLRTSARNSAVTSARKPGRKSGGTSARKPAPASAPEASGPDDLSTEVQALDILARDPGITGSELGRRLGKTPRHGRDLIKRLGPAVTAPDDSREGAL